MTRPLRIGTRGSPLALAQTHMVAAAMKAVHGWDDGAIEIVPITTSGDVIQDRPLADIGGKALWTKELDRALLEGRTDLSVHSMKDVETIRPETLTITAYLPRGSSTDRLIGAESIAALRKRAIVGTSSPRRKAQLLARRPDLQIVPIRGNVQTRLAKIGPELDATVLAAAGLGRLDLADVGVPLDDFLPAPAQGVIGIEIAAGRDDLCALLQPINHDPTRAAVEAERGFLCRLGGNCHSAVAARASCYPDAMSFSAEILGADGREVHRLDAELYGSDQMLPGDVARILLDRASPALRAMFAP
ncbi:MAG: hydroxymethylbilane synthase [Sphingomonas sp.]